ncbi:MAG: hypothetical protein J5608_01430 [Alphaproteobacteria bacterium]|nr:hypothetical protein [Alphaproteobacteria bacterium]
MQEIEKQYARAFQTPAGRAVLQHLRNITIERTLGPNATDNELRWAEAARALVRQIESMVARGTNG